MKIFAPIRTGFYRSLRSWKGVLIIWFFSLILVAILAIPLRGALKSSFGSSMITGKLAEGFNIEVFSDLGPALKSIMSFITSGFMFLMLMGFLMHIFLAGGLFNSLKKETVKFSSSEFFRTSAKNFWSFLVITVAVRIIINFISGLLILIPLVFLGLSREVSEKTIFLILIAGSILFLILMPLFLLVADFARAWQVNNEKLSCFKALGFGIRQTFRKFWSSYPLMLIMLLIQGLFLSIAFSAIPSWRPVTGGGVFLLLIVSQLFIYIRLLLKAWRYAGVTSLMERLSAEANGNYYVNLINTNDTPIINTHE
jgi:hypothetical protein